MDISDRVVEAVNSARQVAEGAAEGVAKGVAKQFAKWGDGIKEAKQLAEEAANWSSAWFSINKLSDKTEITTNEFKSINQIFKDYSNSLPKPQTVPEILKSTPADIKRLQTQLEFPITGIWDSKNQKDFDDGNLAARVFKNLAKNEGRRGDTLTNVETGDFGLTTELFNAIKRKTNNPNLTQTQASLYYIKESNTELSKIDGYKELDDVTKEGILDTAYNLGWGKVSTFPKLTKAINERNPEQIMMNLLDTANADNKSVRGLAKRRAENYNSVNPSSPITSVEQRQDGITYRKGDKVFLEYNKPKHPESRLGSIPIT